MHNLRKLGLAISLSIALSGTALAGETASPPCANPGETASPPCSSTQLILEENTQAFSDVTGEVETIVGEATTFAIESLFTLF